MRYLICLLLTVSTSLSAGAIHKWVDENGNVHYGDAPPAQTKTENVRVQSAPSNPGKTLPRLNQGSDEQAAADDAAASNRQATEASAKEACEKARADLLVLDSNSRIRLQQADGSMRYLTPEEILERRGRTEEEIARFCK
jgi:hypothetical protein